MKQIQNAETCNKYINSLVLGARYKRQEYGLLMLHTGQTQVKQAIMRDTVCQMNKHSVDNLAVSLCIRLKDSTEKKLKW